MVLEKTTRPRGGSFFVRSESFSSDFAMCAVLGETRITPLRCVRSNAQPVEASKLQTVQGVLVVGQNGLGQDLDVLDLIEIGGAVTN